MQLHYSNIIDVASFNQLRAAVGWETLPVAQAQAGIDTTYLLVSCHCENRTIACAKLLWDRGYIAYLADVMVHPNWQGHGIGKHMVTYLIDSLLAQLPENWKVRIFLSAAQGKEVFYEKLGFVSRPNTQFGAGMDAEFSGKMQLISPND